ncbi:hypothetical protein HF086_003474 [Spodoptera exigua]|uniref:Uncharacterized protein n=1 Tax=Spodoptera exigua TaxID=7107 RepID=A0A922MH19_SPOEX|nr:hypothetical protein HF086_003474 [Spodoptera exigua]
MHANLDAVKEIFDDEMAKITRGSERPMVDPYLPPVAGLLWWVHKLRRRIQAPMEDFILFEDPIIESEYALYMKQKTNEMLSYLNVVEDRQFKAWCATVPGICKTHLAKNLIYRDPPFVGNNFSPEDLLEDETLEEVDESTLDEEEKQARAKKLMEIEQRREEARLAREEREREKAEQDRIKFERREAREEVESPAEEEEEIDPEELADIEEEKRELEEQEFRASRWPAYVKYVDSLVSRQIMKAVQASLNLFETQTDLEKGPRVAFMEVIAELRDPDIYFYPSLDVMEEGGLFYTLMEMMKDMFLQTTLFPRIDPIVPIASYEDDLIGEDAMIDLYHEMLKRIENSINDIAQYSSIDKYNAMYDEVAALPSEYLCNGWLRLDLRRLNQAIMNIICKWSNLFKENLKDHVHKSLDDLQEFIAYASKELSVELAEDDYEGLLKVMGVLNEVRAKMDADTDHMFEPLRDIMDVLKEYGVEFPEETYEQLDVLPEKWRNLVKQATVMKNTVAPLQAAQAALIAKRVALINLRLNMYREQFKTKEATDELLAPLVTKVVPWYEDPCLHVPTNDRENSLHFCDPGKLDRTAGKLGYVFPRATLDRLLRCYEMKWSLLRVHLELSGFEDILQGLKKSCGLFDIQPPDEKNLKQCRRELKLIKQLWDYYYLVMGSIEFWKKSPWKKIDADGMDQECKRFTKDLRQLDKEMRAWEPYNVIESTIKNLMTSLRAVTDLQNPAIKDRHWLELMMATKKATHSHIMTINTRQSHVKTPSIHRKFSKSLDDIMKEFESLKDVVVESKSVNRNNRMKVEYGEYLQIQDYRRPKLQEANRMTTFKFNRSYSLKEMKQQGFELKSLGELETTWAVMEFDYTKHERTGIKLPRASEELVETLEDNQNQVQNMMSSKFLGFFEEEVTSWQKKLGTADAVIALWFEEMLRDIGTTPNVIEATNKPHLQECLEELMEALNKCEKALNNYLETKRLAYPRFYFVSSADLLDILSNGNNPPAVCRHLPKLYDNLAKLVFASPSSKQAIEIISKENEEHVPFKAPCCDCTGKVETWLNRVTDCMRLTLRDILAHSVKSYEEKPRDEWVFDWPAQPALVGTQIWWTTETNQAFEKLEEVGDRQKIMTICTIDVHSRDVVAKLIVAKVDSSNAFHWQSQLRHRWDNALGHCFANICDAQFMYDYEYLGNTPRLVITPLTDRCYITLTQSLHLVMGSAPAGPAGTGKTETTKDLGRALGIMVYVFNCSEQMDYKSCGNIYKGCLCQTGAWGCFDEFNRISVEVLSVVSVQVKSVLDAIKAKKKKFDFMGDYITLIPTIGMFITMNPGYAGRTELPENLKALFRPCAMVVPDFELICEIMLVAEGFQDARLLARKFITLYTLCRELLSKQDHYDWGLRAIKSVLVVAGSLKRSDRQRPEDQVLMRALRDFNIPKIVTDDMPVFMGLIGDLFPALDVPRKRDMDFEKHLVDGAISMKLQPEPGFILKMVQLVELFAVRHSVFIVGFAGTGKSMVWQCLNRTYFMLKQKPFYNDLDPKAVTNDELFGIINPATREWKDGLFSTIMRDMANMPGDGPKWIVLDGDIDPMWIESLNTLMDDNKVNTTRDDESEKAMLTVMFDKYIPSLLESCKKYKKITPLTELQQIQLSCYLLECFLNKSLLPSDCPKEWYEIYFVFSVVWGFGSALFQDQIVDWRNEFSKWFCNEFKQIKFPSTGNVFSFFIDPETKKFLPWSEKVGSFELDPDIPLQSTLVGTNETTRTRFFMDLLIQKQKPVMLVGSAGSGKSKVLEKPLEKKSGRNFGPPGSKFMIYFVDDMNMPEVDMYGTVQPHTLIRQFMDYKHWYDRQKLTLKDISNCMFVACMNPTAGSFTIDPRLQRHFCTFAVRINRILEAPRGNALLVGVGGSGKQSLSRLSSFISSLEVFQIQLRKGYGMNDLKVDLAALNLKAGLKAIGNVFLMTDGQIADERFLVLINDLLASGEIAELFPDEDVENIINGVRGETKATGVPDTRENCWAFFINRVRTLLKEQLVDPVAGFMSHVHQSVNEMSEVYYQNEKRYNYTTPKTFLEQIALYSKLLNEKTKNLKMMIIRLENGLEKLASCAGDVAVLKVTLAEQEIILKEKNKAAEALIEVVGAESEKVSKEKAFAAEEEKKVKVIEEDVTIKAKICADDLAKAEPALIAAQEALNTLNKNNLTELKSFGSPPDAVVNAVQPYIKNPEFNAAFIMSKSAAAAGLCSWVINIVKFYEVYVVVEPKRRALNAANAELQAARDKLAFLTDQIAPKIDTTEGLDPLSMLTDDAQVASWNNEGLPTDAMSTENATILSNSARWPLLIDPQLQGLKWIKQKYGDSLVVVRLTQRNYLDRIERGVSNGEIVMLENIGETVEAVLDPLLGRVLIRKGKVLKIGDREIDYHPNFRFLLQTKLANPHYQPEMQAQCTLINFTVTKDGLEDQLLGEVVKAERPDLETLRAGLTKQQNDFKITLKTLEDDLLKRLSSAGPDILSDSALVINLETTKKTAADIEIKVEEGKKTAVQIDDARDKYRLFLSAEPAADPAYHIIPQGILESSIKITNEPPIGMWANLHKVHFLMRRDILSSEDSTG